MADQLRVTLEVGPKDKKVVAVAPDWPGLERGAKTAEAALETLQTYVPRYAQVANIAGLGSAFASVSGVDVVVVERYRGTGSTDFWGISFAYSSIDEQPMSDQELQRLLTLVQGCWTFFDDARVRVSAEMRKGPRGGGRDRDRIVHHVLGVEQDWARKVGVRSQGDGVVTDVDRLPAYRDAFCTAIRTFHAEGKPARNWPLRYLIRHTAYHTMDHAWEMEDKDLTGAVGQEHGSASLVAMNGLLREVDAVTIPVPDLETGLSFYRDRLGHQVIWRNEALGQVGLRVPDSTTEIVLTTTLSYEPDWKVDSVEVATQMFLENGGRVVAGPEDIPIGRVVVVEDPFGNALVLLDNSKGAYRVGASGSVTGVA